MAGLVEQMRCEHQPSRNPRHVGECYKCGQPIIGEGWTRDPERERELLARVERNPDIVDVLYDRVAARAGDTRPWEGVARRDFQREVREELLDGIAYLFGMSDQRLVHGHVDPLSSGQLMCLHHLVQAWKCLHVNDDD